MIVRQKRISTYNIIIKRTKKLIKFENDRIFDLFYNDFHDNYFYNISMEFTLTIIATKNVSLNNKQFLKCMIKKQV